MPKDSVLYPSYFKYKPTLDPVETTKRNLDDIDAKYTGKYLPRDDTYVIEITQKNDIPSDLLRLIKVRGFIVRTNKMFLYKRYSTIAANAAYVEPIYGVDPRKDQMLRRAPDLDTPPDIF